MFKKVLTLFVAILMILSLIAGCSGTATTATTATTAAGTTTAATTTAATNATEPTVGEIKVGVSFVSLQEERFVRERGIMEEYVKTAYPNVEMLFQGADYDPNKQYTQCENLIAQGINTLILNSKDLAIGAKTVGECKKAGISVIAYDEAIDNADLDAFVTFSLFQTGQIMAQYALDKVPEGNYFLMEGDQSQYNALQCNAGKMDILQPAIDAGKIKIIGQQWNKNWDPASALNNMENVLTTYGEDIDAVVCSNDGMATGVIQALASVGLAGKVLVTGQDAELAACQRIVEGTQTMTVYKLITELATSAIDAAVALASGEKVNSNGTYNNGFKDVPAINPAMFAVDKDNMMDTVIKDGWLAEADVYANVNK